MQGEANQTIKSLLGEALRESGDLAQKELMLFRTEMNQNVKKMFLGVGMMVVAAVFSIAALMLFTEALVDWLATILDSRALAALLVGAVMAVIAVGLILYGRHAMSAASLVPKRAVRSVKRDAEILSERVAG
jgi:uncharacterized membrane protein